MSEKGRDTETKRNNEKQKHRKNEREGGRECGKEKRITKE